MLNVREKQLNGWMTLITNSPGQSFKHNCLLLLYLKDTDSEKLKIYSNLTLPFSFYAGL